MWAEKEPDLRFVSLEAGLKENGTCSHGFNQSIEHAVNADVEKHDVSRLWET